MTKTTEEVLDLLIYTKKGTPKGRAGFNTSLSACRVVPNHFHEGEVTLRSALKSPLSSVPLLLTMGFLTMSQNKKKTDTT